MSSYTTAIVSPHLLGSFTKLVGARKTFIFYFPNQKRRNYRWVEKKFGMLSAGAIQFAPRIFCLFKMRRRGDEKVKLAIARQGKTTTLHVHHAFWKISLPSAAQLPVKMPNFTFFFCDGRKQAMTKFILSWTWIWLIEIQLQQSSLAFDKVSELE